MRHTSVAVSMLAGLLAGCSTICDNPTGSAGGVARTASVAAPATTAPCPTCLTQLVMIQKEFKPIADGPAGNWRTHFEFNKNQCVAKSRNAHPTWPQSLFNDLGESMDVKLQGQPKMAILIDEFRACMWPRGYGLAEVKGRSSG